MEAIDYDAVRRDFPEFSHLSDGEISRLPEYCFRLIDANLHRLRKRGEAILAERELQKAA